MNRGNSDNSVSLASLDGAVLVDRRERSTVNHNGRNYSESEHEALLNAPAREELPHAPPMHTTASKALVLAIQFASHACVLMLTLYHDRHGKYVLPEACAIL